MPGFSALYTSNSATHTATVQVGLTEDHLVGSYEYMTRVRKAMREELPELTAYFQSGGLVDAVLNLGLPAPIDIQVSGNDMTQAYALAQEINRQCVAIPGVSDTLIPQDIDAPALQIDVDRIHAAELGMNQRDVVSNIITALNSNLMIAPSFWIDPKTGNPYFLTVQYQEPEVQTLTDLRSIPIRSPSTVDPTRLSEVTDVQRIQAPTEVDHYQLRRVIDVYVAPAGEELGSIGRAVDKIVASVEKPANVRVTVRGMVRAMNISFQAFGMGLLFSVILVYLVLVAQFRSFLDPFLILLAVPPGIVGVFAFLAATGTTLNIMSLMGIIMMVGIVVSNSILIVEFTPPADSGRRDALPRGGGPWGEGPAAAHPDDLTGHGDGPHPHGAQTGPGQRGVRPSGRGDHRRSHRFGDGHRLPGPGGDDDRLPAQRSPGRASWESNRKARMKRCLACLICLFPLAAAATPAEDALFSATVARAPRRRRSRWTRPRATRWRTIPGSPPPMRRPRPAQQAVRETRAAFFPQVDADAGAFDVSDGHNQLAATGGLSDSSMDSRQSDGVLGQQLLTDFGRTASLTASAKFRAGAEEANAATTRAEVLRDVDEAYFLTLQAQSLVQVADETVSDRNLVAERVKALAQGLLKSNLDVSFAEVDLGNAKLLQLEASNRLDQAFARLSNVLGYRDQHLFQLVDAQPYPPPTEDFSPLLEKAFQNRPEILALRQRYEAALKFASAQRSAQYPTIEAVGAAGVSPIRDDAHLDASYAAAGINLSLPLLTGGRLSAAVSEADYRAIEAQRLLENEQNDVGRDVRTAWLDAVTAYKKIGVSEELLANASQSLDLAQARYTSGLSSIVELSQAQLNKTQAEIDTAEARYDYQILAADLKYQVGDFR